MIIKIIQTIAWNIVGDKAYARILIPSQIVKDSFLQNGCIEVQAEYKISNGKVEIKLTKKE